MFVCVFTNALIGQNILLPEKQFNEKYFEKNGDIYTIKDALKKHIVFIHYDLMDDRTLNPPESIYGDFDLMTVEFRAANATQRQVCTIYDEAEVL